MALYPALLSTKEKLVSEFVLIPDQRKNTLLELTRFINTKLARSEKVLLNFICTHNSRRSHLAQLWAQAAAYNCGVPGVECYSGGTEATAFNPRAVAAMRKAGFDIEMIKDGINSVYSGSFAEGSTPLVIFSKRYDDPVNPVKDFAAILTCSHADENCPLIIGAANRIAITYDDPKAFDDTAQEAQQYEETAKQIGREMLYAFSQVNATS